MSNKQSNGEDRNFDDLAKRFKKNIYGGLKGDIRLAVLTRDCQQHCPALFNRPLRILDAGGGQGQFSLPFAASGHSVVLCDISAQMLALAAEQVEVLGVQQQVRLVHGAIQSLPELLVTEEPFDVVICHAVMEWLQEPQCLLPLLCQQVRPGGFISLTFYNLHSLIYKNLLRTNFKKIQAEDYAGQKGSLTPINPMLPEQVLAWVAEQPLTLLCHSGIRVFHDYIFDEQKRERDAAGLLAMELQFSQQEPYRSLGRYQHLLLQRTN